MNIFLYIISSEQDREAGKRFTACQDQDVSAENDIFWCIKCVSLLDNPMAGTISSHFAASAFQS